MRALLLTAETQAVMARIRTYGWTLFVFGMGASQAWRLVKARVERRIQRAGAALQNVNVYRRYVHELVKAFRTQTGEPLAQAIPLTIRKWANLGLEPALLQGLLGDCFLRFEQNGYAKPTVTPSADGKKRGPKARRLPRRSYEKALKKGRASLGRSNTVEQQSARHRASSGRAAEIARKLKPVLAGCGITGPHFVRYFAFAQKLGRYARNYSGESLRMVASDLVDLYEAKSLNGYALRAIAAALFGVTSLD